MLLNRTAPTFVRCPYCDSVKHIAGSTPLTKHVEDYKYTTCRNCNNVFRLDYVVTALVPVAAKLDAPEAIVLQAGIYRKGSNFYKSDGTLVIFPDEYDPTEAETLSVNENVPIILWKTIEGLRFSYMY